MKREDGAGKMGGEEGGGAGNIKSNRAILTFSGAVVSKLFETTAQVVTQTSFPAHLCS